MFAGQEFGIDYHLSPSFPSPPRHRPSLWPTQLYGTSVREADSLHSFKRKLKTHLFTLCFND